MHRAHRSSHVPYSIIAACCVWVAAGMSHDAAAQDPPEDPFLNRFHALDVDDSGRLSRAEYVDPAGEEFRAAAQQEFVDYEADGDGELSYEEFLFTPRADLPAEERFSRLDGNGDQFVEREEFLLPYAEDRRRAFRAAFYHRDRDGDLRVSRDEYLAPPEKHQPHLRSRFALRDLDDDGRVSREEYVAPHVGGKWEQAAKQESVEFDGDNDGFLTLLEFALAPQPADVRPHIFELLDADGDAQLSRDEYLRPHGPGRRGAERAAFYDRDADGDRLLTREEYLVPPESIRPHLRGGYAARDTDGDGRMSRTEYFTPFVGGQWDEAARNEAVQFDMDGDGYLTLMEFAFSPGGGQFPDDVFELLDADHDGRLSRREYVLPRPEPQWIGMGVVFHRLDRDRDGRLDVSEMRGTPDAPLPDPVDDLARQRSGPVLAAWSEFDRDANGTLDGSEWPAAAERLGAARSLPFARWDVDSDGAVTRDELRTVVAALFGVCRRDGKQLRQPDGVVINWAYINSVDLNGDDVVSRQEYVQKFRTDRMSVRRFDELDHDRNGVWDDVELIERRQFAVDVLWDFCRIDADLDDRLSHDEIVASAHLWQQKVCRQLLAAYDADGDESLDFLEYRLTPFANPVIEWYSGQRDVDGDGRLSWEEFLYDDTARFLGIARDVFDHFDLDDDGFLSDGEFDFTDRAIRLPAVPAF